MTQRRPDTYTSINTNTQRTGLPSQSHKIVFLTSDTLGANAPATATEVPVAVYDSAGADKAMGIESGATTSIASRMVDTALKVSQHIRIWVFNNLSSSNKSKNTSYINFREL